MPPRMSSPTSSTRSSTSSDAFSKEDESSFGHSPTPVASPVAPHVFGADFVGTCPRALYDALVAKEIPFKVSTDPEWETDYGTPYNLRIHDRPSVVVVAESTQHIQDTLAIARKLGSRVQARSGGHCYAGFSHRAPIIVDLRHFQEVDLFMPSGIVKVGGGVRLGNLATEIYDQGERALAHGTCAAVGVGGHFTHGGFGFTSRAWGLAMDQIVGVDVVLADGLHVRATDKENEDIFWALRGAADSIGIITDFYLQTQPAPSAIVRFEFDMDVVMTDLERAVEALETLQDNVHKSTVIDRRLGLGIILGPRRFTVHGTFLGTSWEFQHRIKDALFQDFPAPVDDDYAGEEVDWLTCLARLDGGDLNVEEPYRTRSKFYAQGITIKYPGMTHRAMSAYLRAILRTALTRPLHFDYYAMLDLHGGHDSQITRHRQQPGKHTPTDTSGGAYPHRQVVWVVQHSGSVPNDKPFPPQGVKFVQDLSAALTAHLPGAAQYKNYHDAALDRETACRRYYGERILERLRAIKASVDPEDVFRNPQSVQAMPPAMPAKKVVRGEKRR